MVEGSRVGCIAAMVAIVACGVGCPRKGAPSGDDVAGGAMWMETFPSFPGARELASQHISGSSDEGPVHIHCKVYATTSSPEEVVAFYVRRLPEAKATSKRTLEARRVRPAPQKGDVDLAVHPASSNDYPKCGGTLGPTDAAVVIVSQAIRG